MFHKTIHVGIDINGFAISSFLRLERLKTGRPLVLIGQIVARAVRKAPTLTLLSCRLRQYHFSYCYHHQFFIIVIISNSVPTCVLQSLVHNQRLDGRLRRAIVWHYSNSEDLSLVTGLTRPQWTLLRVVHFRTTPDNAKVVKRAVERRRRKPKHLNKQDRVSRYPEAPSKSSSYSKAYHGRFPRFIDCICEVGA